jgi:hypothetical protein
MRLISSIFFCRGLFVNSETVENEAFLGRFFSTRMKTNDPRMVTNALMSTYSWSFAAHSAWIRGIFRVITFCESL